MARPAVLDEILPASVAFASWAKYTGKKRATHYARLEASFLIDSRVNPPHGPADAVRGRFCSLLVTATLQGGKADVQGWLSICSDKVAARSDLKRWLHNGLVISTSSQIEREIDRKRDTIANRVENANGPRKGRTTAASDTPDPPAVERRVTWLSPYAEVWERHNGAGTFVAVAGQAAKCLHALHEEHGAILVSEHLARYLTATEARYRSLNRFAATFSAWAELPPAKETDDAIAASIKRRLSPGPNQAHEFEYATATDDEKRVWQARGGAKGIWGA